MKIDGREIASEIFEDLKQKVSALKDKGIIPHLYVLLLTDDSSTKSYVNQKSLKSEQIGTKITVEVVDPEISTEDLLQKIENLNNDDSVNGLIVQRPVPLQIDENKISETIKTEKDVDGFHPDSKFGIPVAMAVLKILEKIKTENLKLKKMSLGNWLKSKKITVVGRGLTAGRPIIRTFEKIGINPDVVTSKTENKLEILKNSNIVVSCVGKPGIIDAAMLKMGVILIGVGMHKEEDNKFHGDFEEDNIENTVSFYTPTPGGIGPVNVAMLLKNVIEASEIQNQ